MRTRRWLMFALAAAAVLLIAGRSLAGVYDDYLWYDALSATALWRTRITAVVVLRGGSALLAALFAFANLYAVRQSVVSLVFPRRLANLEIGEEVPGRYLIGAAVVLSIVLGVLLALPSDGWTSLVLARTSRPFNEVDPYFGQDLGFFVYWLPLESSIWMWAFVTTLAVGVAVILLYALTPSLKWQRGGFYASTYVRRHFTVLIGVLLLMLAWSFRLDMYSLLVDGSGNEGAFSWADHRVGVPGDLLLSLLTLGAALIVLWAGFAGQFRLAAVSVITAVVLSLIVREIAPTIADHNGTDAQRVLRERPYLATRASYTRRAFGVDEVARTDSSAVFPTLASALPFVSVWDPAALARSANPSLATDDAAPLVGWRTTTTGLLADVLDAPPQGASPKAAWAAERVAASDADERGSPLRVTAGDPSSVEDTPIDPPLVFPAAKGTELVSDSLTRTSGIPLESFIARVTTAWTMQDVQLLSGELPQPSPALIAHRDVRARLDRFAPFFAQGRRIDPILLGADSLYWAVDLYSASDSYPLGHHSLILGEDRNYLRHAAVAIIQASTGNVVLVADSVLDPIAASWKNRLPSLFGTWSALPSGIRQQLAPPVDGIVAQAIAFGRYGARGTTDPVRSIPGHEGADSALTGDPLPFELPSAAGAAFAIPLVDGSDRLNGLVIGVRPNAPGDAAISWYPLTNGGPRWNGVIDRLRSLDSAGNAVREGPLAHGKIRAIPVRGGVAFLQPTYRWRGQVAPTINRIALFAGDTTRSVMPPIATQAPGAAAVSAIPADLRAAVGALYASMRDALRRGDLVAFGHAFDALGQVLNQQVKR